MTILDWIDAADRKSRSYPGTEDLPQLEKQFKDGRKLDSTTRYANDRRPQQSFIEIDPSDGRLRTRGANRGFDPENEPKTKGD